MPVPCRPDQASALLRLKRSFNITMNSTCTLQSWRPGTDCCHWQGVSCGRASGRVTSLHLGECRLESPALDPAVFDLASLRYLNLARNKFQGSEIPTLGFERLTELTHLNLSTCEFAGGIPHAIKRLTNLVSLDLSSEYYLYDQDDSYLSTAVCKAGHEPSRAEFGPSLDLARHERAMLGSARWLNEPASGGSARLAYGSVQPEQLVLPLEAGCVGVRAHQARLA